MLGQLAPSCSQDHVGWEDAPFQARLTSVYVPTSGGQTGQNQYAFIEQSSDPTTGFPQDANPGRSTFPATGPFTSSYAVEVNNTAVTVPAQQTPAGYANPGPYVQMRLQGYVGGAPVYEFQAGSPSADAVALTGLTPTPQLVSFTDGTKQVCVQASINDTAIWLYNANLPGADPNYPPNDPNHSWQGTAFAASWLYPCQPAAGTVDASGTPLYSVEDMPDADGSVRGVVSIGGQTFCGTKTFAEATDASSQANIVTQTIAVFPTPPPASGILSYGELYAKVDGAGNVAAVLSSVTNIAGTMTPNAELWVGPGYVSIGPPGPVGGTQNGQLFPAQLGTALYVSGGSDTGPSSYAGQSGMDSTGSMFINGICVVVGNVMQSGGSGAGSTTGGTAGFVSGGSDW